MTFEEKDEQRPSSRPDSRPRSRGRDDDDKNSMRAKTLIDQLESDTLDCTPIRRLSQRDFPIQRALIAISCGVRLDLLGAHRATRQNLELPSLSPHSAPVLPAHVVPGQDLCWRRVALSGVHVFLHGAA